MSAKPRWSSLRVAGLGAVYGCNLRDAAAVLQHVWGYGGNSSRKFDAKLVEREFVLPSTSNL